MGLVLSQKFQKQVLRKLLKTKVGFKDKEVEMGTVSDGREGTGEAAGPGESGDGQSLGEEAEKAEGGGQPPAGP